MVDNNGQGSQPPAVQPPPGTRAFIGIDISRSKWAFNVRWGEQERRRFTSPYGLEHVQALVQQYAGCELHVAYEACGFGYEIAWWCQGQGIAVTVVPPSTVERAPGLAVKTDRLDARTLCRKLEKGELKSAYIPSRSVHEHRQLSRTYTQGLKDRTRQQARVRSLLQEQGRIGPAPRQGWKVYERWLASQELPAAVAVSVAQLLELRAAAERPTARLGRALLELAERPEYAAVVQALRQQRGVGEFTALRLVLEIGDIRRFASAAAFVRYLGLTPSEYSSGEVVKRGHVLKCGPGTVRAWLIECAWVSIRGHKPDPPLRACFERVAGRAGRKRAIVAVARRLARKLRALWLQALETPPQAAAHHTEARCAS
jgi:transposase